MNSFFRKLNWLTQRRSKEADLLAELQFHLDEETEQHQEEGLAEQQARFAARRELGNVALLQENTRAMWGWTILEQLGQDLRYALRTMAANRLFTILAVSSLALGIGANTAIYSFMDSMLLRPLPVPDPASLVMLNWHAKTRARTGEGKEEGPASVMVSFHGTAYDDAVTGFTTGMFPFGALELFQKSDSVFSSVFAYYAPGKLNLTIKGQADIADGEFVSGDYFSGLRVLPASGRLIARDDDRVGASPVAVVSMALSQRRFGAVAGATGQTILVNNVPFTVVGVAPSEFFGVHPGAARDVYLPMHTSLLLEDTRPSANWYLEKNTYWMGIMARLRPGVSLNQARATLAGPFHQWVEGTASNGLQRANLPALLVKEGARGVDALRREYEQPLYVLMTLVGLILAIACANLANLLLARAASRRREIALRLSIGAGRLRIVRQLLTESLVLASLGGILGVLFATWGIRSLTLLLSDGDPNLALRAGLNWHVLGVAVALSLLTGVLFGLAPAIQSTGVDVLPALKETRAGRTPWRIRVSLGQVLVVSQIAISLLMLVAAGLFVRTLSNLQSIELGFNRENVLLFQLNARQAGHRDPEIAAFYGELRKRFSAVPGVRNVSLSCSPMIGDTRGVPVSVSGTPTTDDTAFLTVGPEFFATQQIPMLLGREIGERDRRGSALVAVVSERFAKANFGNRNPVGQRLTFQGPAAPRDMEIVGVSKNARYGELRGPFLPVVYIPYNQGVWPLDQMTFELRTAGPPRAYVDIVREIVHQADSRVPVDNIGTQAAQIDQTINQEILFARLCTGFAILALVIACVGLYGTVAYDVARRTGEIGIRMALGAQRGSVVWLVLRQVFLLAAVGLAISVPAAFGAARVVTSFLFGMKANDPLALTLAVVTLLCASLLAGYVPARKASRIDPMTALRHE